MTWDLQVLGRPCNLSGVEELKIGRIAWNLSCIYSVYVFFGTGEVIL